MADADTSKLTDEEFKNLVVSAFIDGDDPTGFVGFSSERLFHLMPLFFDAWSQGLAFQQLARAQMRIALQIARQEAYK